MIWGDNQLIRHHFFRFRFTELNEIYAFMSIRSFALALVTIFVPIYLYKEGFGFSNILLFYFYLYLFESIFEYLGASFIKIRGPKHAMILSLPFMIIHNWQLFSLSKYPKFASVVVDAPQKPVNLTRP